MELFGEKIEDQVKVDPVTPPVVDVLMIKHLFESGADAFRVHLMRPIEDFREGDLPTAHVRFVTPSDPKHPDGKHFIVRTISGRCYRARHEGPGVHMWSLHTFENAENDPHACAVLAKAEARKHMRVITA